MSSEIENARRTIDKADEVLRACETFFESQATMNAASHMSERVLYPPLHSAITSVRQGIRVFNESYPETVDT